MGSHLISPMLYLTVFLFLDPIVTSKAENKIAGLVLDSPVVFAIMYANDRYKKQGKVAGI